MRHPVGHRTLADVQRELGKVRAAMLCHSPQSRTWRALKLKRDTLALEYGLTHSSATFAAGSL